MTTAASNRNHPVLSEYYPVLADLIGIYWHFHKDLLAAGSIPFATKHESNDSNRLVLFDIEKIAAAHEIQASHGHLDITAAFREATSLSMVHSWRLFLREAGATLEIVDLDEEVPMPEEAHRYADPYVLGLINDAVDLEKKHPRYASGLEGVRAMSGNVMDGIYTGAFVTTHLIQLLGEDFHPYAPLLTSKVRLDDLDMLAKGLGLTRDSGFDQWRLARGEYTLLDNSRLGLDRDRLREMGLGDTLGCPASMKMNAEAATFLEDRGVVVSGKTVTEELASMMPAQFEHYVGEWYRGLSPEQRTNLIDPEYVRVMSGEARRTALMERATRCPSGKERM